MKSKNIPVSFLSRFNKHVHMLISCDGWGELSLNKITIGSSTYTIKYLTGPRQIALLTYASKIIDIDAAIVSYQNESKNEAL